MFYEVYSVSEPGALGGVSVFMVSKHLSWHTIVPAVNAFHKYVCKNISLLKDKASGYNLCAHKPDVTH